VVRGHTPENERDSSFSGLVGGSGCQGEINLLKTSCHAHSRGLWVVVVAKERLWLPGRGEPPENELSRSLSGVVSSGRLKPLLKLNKK
jgi:hypothetical protein